MNKITSYRTVALTLLVLLSIQCLSAASAGQVVLAVAESRYRTDMHLWVDVFTSQGFIKVDTGGFAGTILVKPGLTNAFLLVGSRRLGDMVEVEVIDAISGATINLQRFRPTTAASQMAGILANAVAAPVTRGAGTERLTLRVEDWQRENEKQHMLSFSLRRALVQSTSAFVLVGHERLRDVLALQALVASNQLHVAFPVVGGMLPAQLSLKVNPQQNASLMYYVSDTLSGQLVGSVTVSSETDVPGVITNILRLARRPPEQPTAR